MTRLAFATALLALSALAGPALADPTPEEIAALIAGKLACAERDAADGWVLTSEADHNGKRASRTVIIIDRKARRFLSRTKSWDLATPESWTFSATALVDGVRYACSAKGAESCEWQKAPVEEDPVRVQEEVTGDFQTFRDLLQPDFAGAALSLDTSEPLAEGASLQLVVTPKNGLPIVMQAAEDGTLVNTVAPYPDGSAYHTRYDDRKQFASCTIPTTLTRTTTPKDTGYRTTTVTNLEMRATMTTADTSIETPARMP